MIAAFAEDFTGTEIHRPDMDKLVALVVAPKVEVVVMYVTDHGVTLEQAGREVDDSTEGLLVMSIEAYAAQRKSK